MFLEKKNKKVFYQFPYNMKKFNIVKFNDTELIIHIFIFR